MKVLWQFFFGSSEGGDVYDGWPPAGHFITWERKADRDLHHELLKRIRKSCVFRLMCVVILCILCLCQDFHLAANCLTKHNQFYPPRAVDCYTAPPQLSCQAVSTNCQPCLSEIQIEMWYEWKDRYPFQVSPFLLLSVGVEGTSEERGNSSVINYNSTSKLLCNYSALYRFWTEVCMSVQCIMSCNWFNYL